MPRIPVLPFALSLVALSGSPAQTRPTIPSADYGRWESPGPALLSPDGRWLAYTVNRVNEENELRIRSLTRDTTSAVLYATAPSFPTNSRWLAYLVGVSPAERDKLLQDKKPIHTRLGLLDLASGSTTSVDKVASFRFSPDGRFLAMRGYAPENSKREAADLMVRDLSAGTTATFGNVTGFAWADRGAALAFTVETESGAGNGVQLLDGNGRLRTLHSSTDRYRALAWRKDGDDLAVLRTQPAAGFRDTAHALHAWTGLNRSAPIARMLPPDAVPSGLRIAEGSPPAWTRAGDLVLVGLRPRDPARTDSSAKSTAKEKTSDVQVWHSRDVRIIPMQKSQEQNDLRRGLMAAWSLADEKLVLAGSDLMNPIEVLEDGRHAVERSTTRYPFGTMFGRSRMEVSLIDLRSGARRTVIDSVRYFYGASTTGRYLLYFRSGGYRVHDITTGGDIALGTGSGAVFTNQEYDTPTDELPPWGIAGWSKDDRSVLVYDRYDLWRLASDGSTATRLTNGAADSTIHRYVRLNREERGIDLAQPLMLSLFGDFSKRGGYASWQAGRVERLRFEDARLSRIIRADSAAAFAFTRERFDDAPDWFVAGPALRDGRQVSALNPFLRDAAWGKAELVGFRSATGRPLQGILLYPANHDPARRYPMIVYTYEILSRNLHAWQAPSERSYYNFTAWTQQGYFVLLPDIVYRAGDPGRSALDAVVPAVHSVIARGLVDSSRVGLVGHSWGGYQATYLPTQTGIFAASVAGAPITNFLSFAGAIHWTPGVAEFDHWETGQARMGAPPWEAWDAHVRNSPAAFITQLKTPMLMMFGDADGTVDWHQGVEFYNFARRAGRPDFVLLVYPGEDHGLRKKENQIDYHRRIIEWFGYYLKGEPAPPWMKEGVTWLDRKKALEGN
ncbi:MAG TPA: prolyl oligopeptidase family serine peptidase [Gemmatimonadales bacterium]